MSAFFDRVQRQAGWRSLKDVHLAIAATGPICRILSLLGACVGFTRQSIIVPRGAPEDEADEVARATSRHLTEVIVVPRSLVRAPVYPDARTVLIRDAGDPRFDAVAKVEVDPDAVRETGFVLTSTGIDFGPDIDALRAVRQGKQLSERAEILILAGELLTAACALAGAWQDSATNDSLDLSESNATLPLPDLPMLARVPDPRIYVGGLGGALSHQFFLAASLDASLRGLLGRKDALIAGADPDVVEESNRSRQIGYSSAGFPKAQATAEWIRSVIPGARVVAHAEAMRAGHFEGGFHGALSSVDSWGWNGRLGLAHLCRDAKVPILLSGGTSFFGGMARVIEPTSACPYEHGVERLLHRDLESGRQSCGSAPAPSSVLPQTFIGGWLAAAWRDLLLGSHPDPRGIEVNIKVLGDKDPEGRLRFGPGHPSNGTCDCPGLSGLRIEAGAAR